MVALPLFILVSFCVFVLYLIIKSILFRLKFNLNPLVFPRNRKMTEFAAWMGLVLVLFGYAAIVILNYRGIENAPLYASWNNVYLNFAGVALFIVGFVIMIFGHHQMGKFWRMGTDDDTELIHSGLFGISRNPIYVAVLFQAAGLTLLLKNVLALTLFFLLVVCLHLIIRTEEIFLHEQFGDAYRNYQKKVRRFW